MHHDKDNVYPFPGKNRQERKPPANVEAEQALLGAILLNNKAVEPLLEILRPEHFSEPFHGRLYSECVRLVLANRTADIVTVWPLIEGDLDAAIIGSKAYLAKLIQNASSENALPYAEMVIDAWKRRGVLQIAERLSDAAYGTQDIAGASNQALNAIDATLFDQSVEGSYTFDEALDKALRTMRASIERGGHGGVHIPGFPTLNSMCAMLPGEVTMLGGLPSVGKSAIAFKWCIDVAKEVRQAVDSGRAKLSDIGGVVAISQEMKADSLANRNLAAESGVSVWDIMTGNLTPAQERAVTDAASRLARLPYVIVAVGGLTLTAMRMRLRQARRRLGGKIRLVVIDHAQSVDPGDKAGDGTANTARIVANGSVAIAKEFDAHVMLLSHLKRGGSDSPETPPTMSDLWGGRPMEGTADNVILLHRPEITMEQTEPVQREDEPGDSHAARIEKWRERRENYRGRGFLILGKVRSGKTGKIDLVFDGPTTSFKEEILQ